MLILITGYLIYDKLSNDNELNKEEIKEENNEENNSKVESDEEDNIREEITITWKNPFDVEAILIEINKIRENESLSKVHKSERILYLIMYDYFNVYDIVPNYECNMLENNQIGCSMRYQKDDISASSDYIVDGNFNSIYGYDGRYINITNDDNVYGIKLEGYLNRLQYNIYRDRLTKQLGYELSVERIYQKFSLTDKNRCIGYTNEDEYFYININEVNGPKLGWYYANLETGECSYMVRQVAQYKIDKETYSYELIEK